MTCTNCGDAPLSMEYTLRCTPPCRSNKVVELHLCHDCLFRLRKDPNIELLDEDSPIPAR